MFPCNVLVCPVGSAGDVYPFLGLGVALKRRGHHVTIMTSGYFQEAVARAGLEFVDQLPAEEFLRLAQDPLLWHPTKGFEAIFTKGVAPFLRSQYEAVASRYIPQQTVVLTSCLGMGARIAQDHLAIPLVTLDLQPALLWSRHQPPTLWGVSRRRWVPGWFKQFQFWIGETFFLSPIALPAINRLRDELGLPPVRQLTQWWHSPDCILCLFPEWYASRQPDWPAHVHLTQFPLWDEGAEEGLPPSVESWLKAGDPPVVFTAGSANFFGREFFVAAADACHTLGWRGLLMTRFEGQLPSALPEGVRHEHYLPFSRLLPRAAAIVHHGGIGTAAQALAAGIPQVIVPISHDQPDNALRVQRLSAGDIVPNSRLRPDILAETLRKVVSSESMHQACREIARRISRVDPFAAACDVIEQYAARHGASPAASAGLDRQSGRPNPRTSSLLSG